MILQIQTDDKRISTWSTGQSKTELINILAIVAEYANDLPNDTVKTGLAVAIKAQKPIETQYDK